jgi:hypothetical protein
VHVTCGGVPSSGHSRKCNDWCNDLPNVLKKKYRNELTEN